MSQSPDISFINGSETTGKKRKINNNTSVPIDMSTQSETPSQGPSSHVPKRGARACTNCRRGKNRCEGEPPCKRCQQSGTPCIFEKPEKKNVQGLSNGGLERLARLEGQYLVLQSQMIGMQTSLDRILQAIQTNPNFSMPPPIYPPPMEVPRDGVAAAQQLRSGFDATAAGPADRNRMFPPMPGFPPAAHKFANFGMVPNAAASSEEETDETLPRASLNAPIEALQGLANAAVEAAAAPSSDAPRVKKRKRTETSPKNTYPHVVEKGLVTDSEARELFNIFFAGCHLFIPIFDPSYDTYESLMERSPWTFDAILTVAAKIRSGNGPLTPTFYKCLEDAQGIARSSLFGPVVRKEAVQGMLLLAAWSANGWVASGHAMRIALNLGLHLALEKLADTSAPQRSDEEERDLIVSARIWLCLYWFDHQTSLGTGRPIVLRDENTIRHCRLLLTHPMTSPTDIRLVSLVELIAHKTQIYEWLAPLTGQYSNNTLAVVRRAYDALDKWWASCDEIYRRTMDQEALLRKVLACELHYSKLWLVSVSLRGIAWDKMPFDQRELAYQAKDAASQILSIFLTSSEYRAALRYAVNDTLVMAAFSGLFLLKMAYLFPAELDLGVATTQTEQLTQLLSDVAAERYAMTLRIMLANLRRKVGVPNVIASQPPPQFVEHMVVPPNFQDPSMPNPFTIEELGFIPPGNKNIVSPATIPFWVQEQNLTDIGFPMNGSDGVFMNLTGVNGWTFDFALVPEAR